MKPKLYLETTIPSYLTARPTRDPLMAGKLAATKNWGGCGQMTLSCSHHNSCWTKQRAEMPLRQGVGLGYRFPVVCTPLELMGTSEP